MSRYEIIKSYDEKKYISDPPIIILNYALTADHQNDSVLAQIKFQNLSEKEISALYIHVDTYGVDGKQLEGNKEHAYLDLQAGQNTVFGSNIPVHLPDNKTRDLSIFCDKIVYSDSSVCTFDKPQLFQKLEEGKRIKDLLGGIEFDELRHVLKKESIPLSPDDLVTPVRDGKIWQCACGTYSVLEKCPSCLKTYDWWRSHLEKEYLVKSHEDRMKLEAEQRAHELEIQREKEEAGKRARIKALKVGAVVLGAVLAILIGRQIYNHIIVPNGMYKQAMALAEESKYEEANDILKQLENRDYSEEKINAGKEKILASKYEDADECVKQKKFKSALDLFSELGSYSDSKERITDTKYLYAKEQYERGEYDKAISAFKDVIDYSDSAELLKKAEEDRDKAVLETAYNTGLQEYKQKHYKDAVVWFADISDYKDACYYLGDCYYQQEEYEQAEKELSKVKKDSELYEDAQDKLKECKKINTYNSALSSLSNGRIAEAKKALESIKGFKDSDEKLAVADSIISEGFIGTYHNTDSDHSKEYIQIKCEVDISNNERLYSVYKQNNKEETIYKNAKIIDGKLVAFDEIDDTNPNAEVDEHPLKESTNMFQPDKSIYNSNGGGTGVSGGGSFISGEWSSGGISAVVPGRLDYSTYTAGEKITYEHQNGVLRESHTILKKRSDNDSVASNDTTTFEYEGID